MKNRQERDEEIRRQIEQARNCGVSLTEALVMTASKFFLSYETVKDIYYKKR